MPHRQSTSFLLGSNVTEFQTDPFASPSLPGSAIIVPICFTSGAVDKTIAVEDEQGNIYKKLLFEPDANVFANIAVWYCLTTKGGSNRVTVRWSDPVSVYLSQMEYTEVAAIWNFKTAKGNATPVATASLRTTRNGKNIVFMLVDSSSSVGLTGGPGFTVRQSRGDAGTGIVQDKEFQNIGDVTDLQFSATSAANWVAASAILEPHSMIASRSGQADQTGATDTLFLKTFRSSRR